MPTCGDTHLQHRTVRIGTRGSPLALAQAHEVRARLMTAHGLPETAFAISVIKTSGDEILDRPLAEVGGKGLFTKEIEQALLSDEIDLAVHSTKDMATELPPGLKIGAILPREDVCDALISLKYSRLDDIPGGAIVGTSSLRRQAQLKNMRPDLEVIGFRGNVQTRLTKLADGVADATFLACAGLKRLGLEDRITEKIATGTMLPAVAQGAIGIEIRSNDAQTARVVSPLNDEPTETCVIAERAFLARLNGSCRTPIGGLAELNRGELHMRGQILSPDGRRSFFGERRGPSAHAIDIGDKLALELLDQAGPGFLET